MPNKHTFCIFAKSFNNNQTKVVMSKNKESEANAGFVSIPMADLEPNEGQLAGLPANPRQITEEKFALLKQNIEKYPEMLNLRGLMVYPLASGKYIVIGGNMRYRAMLELGYTAAPCVVIPTDTPIDRLKAYTIIDNNGFGKYEWDMIANEWDMDEVKDWGLDISALGEMLHDGAYNSGDDNIDGAAKSDKADRNLCKCPHCGYIANKKEFEHENIS